MNPKSLFSSVILKKRLLLLFFVGFSTWVHQTAVPPPPKTLGSLNGPPITSPRIKLHDRRFISYIEYGVSKDVAKSIIIYVHCFDCCKHHNPLAITASPGVIEDLGVYMVAIDRPAYGESDPHPKRTVKSLALDIEELADQLNIKQKFYVAGYSTGGQIIWSCLKYIPHRLAGAVLISPAFNYWWHSLPSNLSNEAYYGQLQEDQWSFGVAYYLPWLTYWWNTQKWFPSSIINKNPAMYTPSDIAVTSKLFATVDSNQAHLMNSQPRLQGDPESVHRDFNIGFGKCEFDPIDLKNPFPKNDGSVHLWMGDEDRIVPVTLQRYIAQQLKWVKYHEVAGGGHTFAFAEGMGDLILKDLLK